MNTAMDEGSTSEEITFCTLGMFIIDEIEYKPPVPKVKNVVGGAGSYAAIGARLATPPTRARSVGWIVDTGADFPPEVLAVLQSWNTTCLFRHDPSRLTTRGWNGYGENEERAFKYLTPKIRLDQHSLPEPLLFAKSFHFVCSPKRCLDLVAGILKRRNEIRPANSSLRPLFVWEPVPDLCTPEEYPKFKEAIRVVDIVSPNESELGAYFGLKDLSYHGGIMPSVIDTVLETGVGPNRDGALIVRLGKDGCYCKWQGNEFHFNSYHETIKKAILAPHEFEGCRPCLVVDPTGGGNTFLGALAQAMVNKRIQMADESQQNFGHREDGTILFDSEHLANSMIWATLAASWAIEQVGLPNLSHDEHGREMWNREMVLNRMALYRKAHGLPQQDLSA